MSFNPGRVNNKDEDSPIKAANVDVVEKDMDAKKLNSYSDQKGWIWRKDGYFKSSKYWAILYDGQLHLYLGHSDKVRLSISTENGICIDL